MKVSLPAFHCYEADNVNAFVAFCAVPLCYALQVAKAPAPEPEPEKELTAEQKRELKQMFHMYDKNKDGLISLEELQQAMKKTVGCTLSRWLGG